MGNRSLKRQLHTLPKAGKQGHPGTCCIQDVRKYLERKSSECLTLVGKCVSTGAGCKKATKKGEKSSSRTSKQAQLRLWEKPFWKRAGPKVVTVGLPCDLGTMHQRNRKVCTPRKKAYSLCVSQLVFLQHPALSSLTLFQATGSNVQRAAGPRVAEQVMRDEIYKMINK